MSEQSERAPSANGVLAAEARLDGKAIRTPLIENRVLNEAVGARVFVKAENLQHCGAFKFRGAYNFMAQLSPEERRAGVVAWSSGNHAQGVALAAKMLGAPATIVMPADAPRIKADMVRRLGAEIVTYDRYSEDREAIGRRLSTEKGASLAPSYDHPWIIEGQGTAGLETARQAARLGVALEAFIVCCGGGGLASGCALGFSVVSPDTRILIAEPEFYDDTLRSLAAGERLTADVSRPTLCDAIATPSPGALTFPILQRYCGGGAAVSEAEVRAAMRFAFLHLKLVVEPGGAVALAALLSGRIRPEGPAIGLILSGGNVDPERYAGILADGAA